MIEYAQVIVIAHAMSIHPTAAGFVLVPLVLFFIPKCRALDRTAPGLWSQQHTTTHNTIHLDQEKLFIKFSRLSGAPSHAQYVPLFPWQKLANMKHAGQAGMQADMQGIVKAEWKLQLIKSVCEY